MSDPSQEPVLRKKVGARRASLGLAEMTPAKAMRLALAKVGDTELSVPVGLRAFQQASLMPEDLQEALPDPALILQLEDSEGAVGLVIACPQTVAAANEARTMGRVSQSAAPDRKPTATDAAMSRGFLEQVLGSFAVLAEECPGLPPLHDWSVRARLPDARVAAMTIEDARHTHFVVEIDFVAGAKSGVIHYVLPNTGPRLRLDAAPGEAPGTLGEKLEPLVLTAKAQLEARLCKIRLPLAEAKSLEVGQLLELDDTTLDSITLHALNGRKVVNGRLGKSGPMRAVRVQLRDGAAPAAGLGMDVLTEAAAPAPPSLDPPPLDDLPSEPEPFAAPLEEPAPLADLDNALPAMVEPSVDMTDLDELPDTLDPMPLTLDLPE